eukprot:CAMPEP_0178380970 /NCGR_PEP_ID=MMETSP0689_2-20121128/5740_1 /TAXON_ID=160604 /ORGANISM="Amphidinium massartii, Strain CS-259" /LENGTH=704 /DNA_ID=CAMNT_0020001135 /DNA_START=1 /DNA_END=2115 /DNA_ORIENTATION=-
MATAMQSFVDKVRLDLNISTAGALEQEAARLEQKSREEQRASAQPFGSINEQEDVHWLAGCDPEQAFALRSIYDQHVELLKELDDRQRAAIQEIRFDLRKKVMALQPLLPQGGSPGVSSPPRTAGALMPPPALRRPKSQPFGSSGGATPGSPFAGSVRRITLESHSQRFESQGRNGVGGMPDSFESSGVNSAGSHEMLAVAPRAVPTALLRAPSNGTGIGTATSSFSATTNGSAWNVGRRGGAALNQHLRQDRELEEEAEEVDSPGRGDDSPTKAAERSESAKSVFESVKKALPRQQSFLHFIDILVAFSVLTSACVYFVQLLWEGYKNNVALDLEPDGRWEGASDVFTRSEQVFNMFFLLELGMRVMVSGFRFFKSIFNCFDATVVLVSAMESFVFRAMFNFDTQDATFMRLLRFMRLARTVRIVRVLNMYPPLRVLLKTIASSLFSLVWCMLVLGIIQVICAMIMCQTLISFINDSRNNLEVRLWVNQHYGSASKSFWTMFEITFSGGWPNYARPLIENVSPFYSIFFAVYVTFVVFAIIRIINALFLQETLKVASADLDMQVQMSMAEKQSYIEKLRGVFEELDESGDGLISLEEFQSVFTNARVKNIMSLLGLEIHEVSGLYDLLDDGDGQITYDEFVNGIIVLKGQARSQDVIAILHDSRKILKLCADLHDQLLKQNGYGSLQQVQTIADDGEMSLHSI